ncbi:MAG TPA: 4-(cytidine 5'-diphospho)-2-C-methyl-D-erythritol kinase, partial [Acetobacteraceae bacterium]
MRETAPAKVNLYLHVTGRRADGFHLLDSLVVFPRVGDLVQAASAEELSLSVEGPFAGALSGGDNLVLRAARSLATRVGVRTGARMVLTKNLPVASGIGGGSADAAAALRLLSRLWHVSPETVDLPAVALSLGADVPVCLRSRPLRMRGIGEDLAEAPALPACGIVLVNPGVPVATADVFRARQGHFSASAELPAMWHSATAMARQLAQLSNDLEAAALVLCPAIGTVL